MARISKGILGPLSGTVGPVVGSTWKGISYIRSASSKRSGSSTAAQIEQQLKFSLIIHFLQTFTSLLELTFKKYAIQMTAFNAAFAYNIREAITGISPDFEVDYQKALLSRGDLPNASGPAVTATANMLHYTWTDNSGTGLAYAADKAIFIAFCPAMNISIFTIGNAQRDAGAGTLNLASFAGQTVETWISFITENDKEAANSFYTGQITL